MHSLPYCRREYSVRVKEFDSNPEAYANPHRFRHTFGADMARSGMNISVLQKIMGHENIEMTLHYINLSLADIADAFHIASAEIHKRYELLE